MISVRAKEPGFYGGVYRETGEQFEVEKESHLGRWMERLDAPQPDEPKLKKGGKAPQSDEPKAEVVS